MTSLDALYWLLSTVSQTLVALVALVGIIVVYRIDKLHQSVIGLMDSNTAIIFNVLGENAYKDRLAVLSELENWFDTASRSPHTSSTNKNAVNNILVTWKSNEDIFRVIRKDLRLLIIVTLGTIFLSIAGIFTLENNSPMINFVVAITVLMFSALSFWASGRFFFALFGKNLITWIERKSQLDLS